MMMIYWHWDARMPSEALALQNELLAAFSVRDPVGFLWADAYWTRVPVEVLELGGCMSVKDYP